MASPAPIRLVHLGIVDGWKTQAAYHAVAELMRKDSQDTIILCRPATPYVCIGYHQVCDDAVDRERCSARSIPVYRRRLGGGATYLDRNQLFYQCIFHVSRIPPMIDRMYERMLSGPVAVLRRLGLNAALRETNEIEVDGRRVAGTGGGWIGEAAVIVGNFLLDFDYDAMTGLWHVPSETFRTMASAALRERIHTLKSLCGRISVEHLETLLAAEFAAALERQLTDGMLTAEEEELSAAIGRKLSEAVKVEDEQPIRATPPLKISADVYIHGENIDLDGRNVRGTYRVDAGIIKEVVLEYSGERMYSMEHRLTAQLFRRRNELFEPDVEADAA